MHRPALAYACDTPWRRLCRTPSAKRRDIIYIRPGFSSSSALLLDKQFAALSWRELIILCACAKVLKDMKTAFIRSFIYQKLRRKILDNFIVYTTCKNELRVYDLKCECSVFAAFWAYGLA
jgi:hypothetical protein